jgi:hypothetical protein
MIRVGKDVDMASKTMTCRDVDRLEDIMRDAGWIGERGDVDTVAQSTVRAAFWDLAGKLTHRRCVELADLLESIAGVQKDCGGAPWDADNKRSLDEITGYLNQTASVVAMMQARIK